jgi:hypothetical protein
MQSIKDYMLKSREERKQHLKLNEPCDERGLRYSYNMIGLLAWLLDTSIPQKGDKAIVCHGCNNAKCSNPNHLYWGSYKDNHMDQVESGTYKSIYERSLTKYGDAYKQAVKSNGSKGGKNNAGIAKSDAHKQHISDSLFKKSKGPSS